METKPAAQRPIGVYAQTSEVLESPSALGVTLSAIERSRASRFRRKSLRDDYVAAHILVRLCAARWTKVPVQQFELVNRCPTCGSDEHGAPSLLGQSWIHVSIAHADGVVAAAIGPGPVGIDVERRNRMPGESMIAHVLAPGEQALVASNKEPTEAFLRFWVRKECLVKIGRATLDNLNTVDLSGISMSGAGEIRSFEDMYFVEAQDERRNALVAMVAEQPPVLLSADSALN